MLLGCAAQQEFHIQGEIPDASSARPEFRACEYLIKASQ
jgi:hypothetical protein